MKKLILLAILLLPHLAQAQSQSRYQNFKNCGDFYSAAINAYNQSFDSPEQVFVSYRVPQPEYQPYDDRVCECVQTPQDYQNLLQLSESCQPMERMGACASPNDDEARQSVSIRFNDIRCRNGGGPSVCISPSAWRMEKICYQKAKREALRAKIPDGTDNARLASDKILFCNVKQSHAIDFDMMSCANYYNRAFQLYNSHPLAPTFLRTTHSSTKNCRCIDKRTDTALNNYYKGQADLEMLICGGVKSDTCDGYNAIQQRDRCFEAASGLCQKCGVTSRSSTEHCQLRKKWGKCINPVLGRETPVKLVKGGSFSGSGINAADCPDDENHYAVCKTDNAQRIDDNYNACWTEATRGWERFNCSP
ncbi:MAG: hypothetical protein Q7T03_00375 [Deltaproteobacteria bacterium]|nr:hypothetical protein [Deltaproteobacteria bacterium]